MTARRIDWPRVLVASCAIIERAEEAVPLAALAAASGVSASELQRQFIRRMGTSPHAYAQAIRLYRLARSVGHDRSATDAVLKAGFDSVKRGYVAASSAYGVAPGKLRNRPRLGWFIGLSDLGWMLLGATNKGVCWLSFGDDPDAMIEELRTAFPKAEWYDDSARLLVWFEKVREYVLLPREALDLPVAIQGTAFQSRVWRALRRIGIGETVSYGELAARVNAPRAARAVASACAQNRLAVLIPCHRVVGAHGRLAGYRWGPGRKAELLDREAGRESSKQTEKMPAVAG